MRAPRIRLLPRPTTLVSAPGLIAAGLTFLIGAALWPSLPAITGMALVMLGATTATVEKFRTSPLVLPIVGAHAVVYVSLYMVFVAAVLDAASRTQDGVTWATATDLGVSLWLFTTAVGLVLDAMRGTQLAE